MVDKLHQSGGYSKLSWNGIKYTAGKFKGKIGNLLKGRQVELLQKENTQKDRFKGIRNFFKNPSSSLKKTNLGSKAKKGTSSKGENRTNQVAKTFISSKKNLPKKKNTEKTGNEKQKISNNIQKIYKIISVKKINFGFKAKKKVSSKGENKAKRTASTILLNKSQFESQLKNHSKYVSSQKAADEKLKDAKPGDYVIRPNSQKADRFTLIIKNKGKYVIEIADNGFNVIVSGFMKSHFNSLESLIGAYLPKKQPEVKVYDDISEIGKKMDRKQNVEDLKGLKKYTNRIDQENYVVSDEPGTYFIRPSKTKKDSYTFCIKDAKKGGSKKYIIDVKEKGFDILYPDGTKHFDDINELKDELEKRSKEEKEVYEAKEANNFETFTGAEFELRENSNFVSTTVKAEEKMNYAKPGDYLLRPSSDGKKYTLCIKSEEGTVIKRNIEPLDAKYKIITPGTKQETIFDNLDQLILYYRLR